MNIHVSNNQGNEIQVPFNTSDRDSNSANTNCSYCNKLFIEKLWCEECDPCRIVEGWTSGNPDIDKFIKDTMYDARDKTYCHRFLEWVPFDRFADIKQIGEGGFAKVYSATWLDGKLKYEYENYHGIWKKLDPEPTTVALKRLSGSQNIAPEHLNELRTHWKLHLEECSSLIFYGITKDPETKEFMMIIQFANKGNLRNILSSNFNNILWKDKIKWLWQLLAILKNIHNLEYVHKNFHSGNILQVSYGKSDNFCILDFGLSGPANKQKSDDKIYGVLPYIPPEVLNGKPYTSSSNIYSFGVIMVELSSGTPPFCNRKHDSNLALEICKGLRPEFGKGTPEIYKKIAYKCMNAIPNQRLTANELIKIFEFWRNSTKQEKEESGYKQIIKAIFDEANKKIPNITTSYEKDSDAVYTSQEFTFNNLPKSVNSSSIPSYEKVYKSCSYCNKSFIEELWCTECDPHRIMEGWSSENPNIDNLIKDTMFNAKEDKEYLEWVPFDRFVDMKQIGEGGFSKVYSATWIDGKYFFKKLDSKPTKVALKRLNNSQNMSTEYLDKLKTYWNFCLKDKNSLEFYGMTKDPETKEFMMIIKLANKGNLGNFLSSNFRNILWKDKIDLLYTLVIKLNGLHNFKYFHSKNILLHDESLYISDYGLSGPASEQKTDNKIYGILPYIAPEILNGKQYTSSANIYSFGVIMVELSSGTSPFDNRKYDSNLALEICNGLRPEFGRGTPEIYKKLAYKCMNVNASQRPSAFELYEIIKFWKDSIKQVKEEPGYKQIIKDMFNEANKEIPNISTYKKESDSVYTSQEFTFKNLPKPVNLPVNLSFESIYINCSYCKKLYIEELWCETCDPHCIIKGWTSGNPNIDKLIKDTMFNAKRGKKYLEWVPFNKFTNVEQIGEGGFSKVYSAMWIDSKNKKVVLKRLNESQNISANYLNELKTHWKFYLEDNSSLKFYGMTKDSESKEFMMIIQFANKGNLRNILSNFGLSGPANEQKPDDKIYGVLPYIAPEILNGKPYTSSSDIYSFGVVMAELSSGKPPFYNKKHDLRLSLDICDGLRPEFGKGTPEIYKKLAYRCMDDNPNLRPTTTQLYEILNFLNDIIKYEYDSYQVGIALCQEFVDENFNYNGKKIKAMFDEADKEIPNISTSYEKDPGAIYTSRAFKPINDEDRQDSQLVNLDVMML